MSLRTHFEQRAVELAGLAILQVSERDGAVYMRLQPRSSKAVDVTPALAESPGVVGFEVQRRGGVM